MKLEKFYIKNYIFYTPPAAAGGLNSKITQLINKISKHLKLKKYNSF